MKNPMRNISIFKVEKGVKTHFIVITYSKSGIVYAFDGYSEKHFAKAGGYGYDKIHTALAEAIEHIFELDIDANGLAGYEHVREQAEKHGINVKTLIDCIYNSR